MIDRQRLAPAETFMDTSVLREFLDMVGPDGPALLCKIVATYAVETPPVLTALGMALKRGDHSAAMRLAHRLRGSCLSIGASRLAANCAAVEDACSSGLPFGAETYATLCQSFEATTDALHGFLEELQCSPHPLTPSA